MSFHGKNPPVICAFQTLLSASASFYFLILILSHLYLQYNFIHERGSGKNSAPFRHLSSKAFLDRNKVKNFSIWNAEDLIFGYYENEDGAALSAEENAAKDAITAKIQDTFDWISTPGKDMRLMYHNFGVVRENKELIRHRMFMTKLKDGCEEEYKRRHDGLIEQRGDTVDPGPDSNFSIWSAGGYIFGYDEIDTTMEVEETVEEREQTVEWEMRQLGIMDWITNDVDWMTGDVHADVKRLAWHN